MKKSLIKIFKRKPQGTGDVVQAVGSSETSSGLDGFVIPKTAEELLGDERRQILMDNIWEQTSVSKESFSRLYHGPISRYAELVQQLPASENHHHSYLGGMLDHSLELVLYALKLRQGYLLPIGVSPEEQAQLSGIWTAGAAYGGLMHDTGKIFCDIEVQTQDGKIWHPWNGPLDQPYRFRYIKGRDYRLHNAAASILCTQILGTEILSWLARNQNLWASLLYLLSGDYEKAGALAEIVSRADRTSTALSIGANPEKALQAPPESLQAHLARGLRELFTNEEYRLKINVPGAAGWLTQDGLWLVSKVVADKLRAFLLSQGVDKVPSKNSSLFDELQSHRLIQPNSEGNAIWKATVTDGQWQQEFTFLRIQPSMIWGNGEYPDNFKGTVTFDGEPVTNQQQEQITPAAAPAQVPATQQQGTVQQQSSPSTIAVAPAAAAPVKTTDDGIDDVLALLGMDDLPSEPVEPVPPEKATTEVDRSSAVNTDNTTAKPQAAPKQRQTTEEKPQVTEQRKAKKPTQQPQKTNTGKVPGSNLTLDNLGQAFMDWLKEAIANRDIYINDSRAPLHIVGGKAFIVTPTIFQRFTGQFPEVQQLHGDADGKPWSSVQRAFERLKVHIKREDDLNIFQCTVRGPRKSGNLINGYLVPAELLFTFQPQDNPFVVLKQEK